jgi:hypothetical protein
VRLSPTEQTEVVARVTLLVLERPPSLLTGPPLLRSASTNSTVTNVTRVRTTAQHHSDDFAAADDERPDASHDAALAVKPAILMRSRPERSSKADAIATT